MDIEVEKMAERVMMFLGTKEEFLILANEFCRLVHDERLSEDDRRELSGYGEVMVHLNMYYLGKDKDLAAEFEHRMMAATSRESFLELVAFRNEILNDENVSREVKESVREMGDAVYRLGLVYGVKDV